MPAGLEETFPSPQILQMNITVQAQAVMYPCNSEHCSSVMAPVSAALWIAAQVLFPPTGPNTTPSAAPTMFPSPQILQPADEASFMKAPKIVNNKATFIFFVIC
jgi:hypothetical protein